MAILPLLEIIKEMVYGAILYISRYSTGRPAIYAASMRFDRVFLVFPHTRTAKPEAHSIRGFGKIMEHFI